MSCFAWFAYSNEYVAIGSVSWGRQSTSSTFRIGNLSDVRFLARPVNPVVFESLVIICSGDVIGSASKKMELRRSLFTKD